jgi:hypothetical protein
MSQDVIDVMSRMGDRYVSSSRAYICISGSSKVPHYLPHYAPYHLILLDVAYQTHVKELRERMT